MPFYFFKSKDNVDYKARLERKMCVAKEAPEPIFDLTECNLKSVPSGVFAVCKVLRKEALFLQNNVLTSITSGGFLGDLSLIKILDLSFNKLSRLPDEIGCLTLLEDLNMEDNLMTCLPDSIGKLKCLKKLNLRRNKLKHLPKSLGKCRGLIFFDCRENSHLLRLPVEMGGLKNLEELQVDAELQFPELAVISQGTAATIMFLQSERDDVWSDEIEEPNQDLKLETDFFLLQEKLKMIEQRKELEKNERLAWEKLLIEDNEKERLTQETMKVSRTDLIEAIKVLQNGVEEDLSRIQKLKDVDRSQLVLQCLETEERARSQVGIILENAKKIQDRVAQMTDREREMENELLFEIHKKKQTIEKSRVLDAMNEMVQDELRKTEKFKKSDNKRHEILENLIKEESELTVKLKNLVDAAKSNAKNLTDVLLVDEELQKAAVASLMEQSDINSWNLARQVSSIEAQLAELTQMEITRQKIQQDNRIMELSTSRIALTELLLDLFAQQKERRQQLVSALNRMEGVRGENESFWLDQYQRLLESNSCQLVKTLKSVDNALHLKMAQYGVSHYLSILAEKLLFRQDVAAITNQALLEWGVLDDDDRLLLLKAFNSYLEESDVLPSAPELQDEASAPPMSPVDKIFVAVSSNECVVCMENTVDAIFIPCGHMCCCLDCARLDSCPICRAAIDRVLQSTFYQ